MKSLFYIILFTFISYIPLSAQSDSTIENTEETLDNILQEPNEETDNSNLYEIFEDLLKNPVDINKADLSELQRIPSLDLSTAKIILAHRNTYGYFFSTNELYSIHNISKDLIDKIIPFLKVSKAVEKNVSPEEETKKRKNYSIEMRNRVLEDIQERRGFTENKFAGSKYKIYNRVLANYQNKIELGLLTDKDPGEKSFNEFTSFHLAIKNLGLIKSFIAGDYYLEFGQGLTLWSAYGFSKGADAIYPVKKRERKVQPYRSSTENNFFRGAAATISMSNFSISAFYSKNNLDANIDSSTEEILSTPIDGLHRTELEINKRKTVQETMAGASLNYSIENALDIGVLYYHSAFSHPFYPNSIYDIQGDNFNYYSFSYNSYIKKINAFGEFSYNGTSVASLNGIEISISKNFSFITSIRSYPKNFNNLHGFGFGERSGKTKNEFGIYNGIKWRTQIGLLNFYFDQFKFPYATFDNPVPSEGNEFLIDLTSKPIRKLETRFRYKNEKKEITSTFNDSKILVNRLRQSFRAEIIYNVSKYLRLKGRFEYNKIFIKELGINEEGYLMFQGLRFNASNKINFYTRIIVFKTQSFNSAVYEYENDLNGILTNRAMFDEGMRWYFIVRYRPIKVLTLSCKYAETYKPNKKFLGSGYSEIEGNLDNKLSVQLDFSL